MRKDKFIDAVGGVDDVFVNEGLNIDSASKLKAAVAAERHRRLMRTARVLGAAAACLTLIVGVTVIARQPWRAPVSDPSETTAENLVQGGNPVVEVEGYDAMEQELGFYVPRLTRTVERFEVVSCGGRATEGHVWYADGSALFKAHGTGDISGVFGAQLKNSVVYDGVTVYFYAYGDGSSAGEKSYAVWSHNGCSYCYRAADDDIYDTVRKIVTASAGR